MRSPPSAKRLSARRDENVPLCSWLGTDSATRMIRSALVGIVDYGMGNVQSVLNAILATGASAHLVRRPSQLDDATHIVLPGVGAFPDGMAMLEATGWDQALRSAVFDDGRPLLGICLGMQMLMTNGTEHGACDGLGWVSGSVIRLPEAVGFRVPHIGWNDVHVEDRCLLFEGIHDNSDFYFVHSYAAVPDEEASVAGTSDHGDHFVAAVHHRQIHGVQFHPEKSHRAGLALLINFVRCDGSVSC